MYVHGYTYKQQRHMFNDGINNNNDDDDERSLDELRSLGKPPDGVKMAMEAMILMVRPEHKHKHTITIT